MPTLQILIAVTPYIGSWCAAEQDDCQHQPRQAHQGHLDLQPHAPSQFVMEPLLINSTFGRQIDSRGNILPNIAITAIRERHLNWVGTGAGLRLGLAAATVVGLNFRQK